MRWSTGCRRLRPVWVALMGVLCAAGCRTTDDWNPFVDLSAHERVVVLEFTYEDAVIGRQFADQLASELVERAAFEDVLRRLDGGRALVVSGAITQYDEGDVAARIKYGQVVGAARMSVFVQVSELPSGQTAGTFSVEQSTLLTGPDAGRTGRESIEWVRREVAERVADGLLARMRE